MYGGQIPFQSVNVLVLIQLKELCWYDSNLINYQSLLANCGHTLGLKSLLNIWCHQQKDKEWMMIHTVRLIIDKNGE